VVVLTVTHWLEIGTGKFVLAGCTTRMGCLDSSTAETLSALRAIKSCKERGVTKIHLEGDATVVIDALLSGDKDRSPIVAPQILIVLF
jgi:ribonuclease HI